MISRDVIEQVINEALLRGGDFAEVYIEDTNTTEFRSLGGVLENGMTGRDFGIGIRVFSGLKSYYGYTSDKRLSALIQLTRQVTEPIHMRKHGVYKENLQTHYGITHPCKIQHSSIAFKDKIALTKSIYSVAKGYDALVTQASIYYLDQEKKVLIANSRGVFVEDSRQRTRVLIQVVAEYAGQSEVGYVGPGALMGYEFYDTIDLEAYARQAAESAVTMAKAELCPSGVMPVVIANGFGGLMIHEACGHSLEASAIAKNLSVFCHKLDQKIAADQVTLIDDGSIVNGWGSSGIDDEGNLPRKNVLIDKGVLKSYLVDEFNGLRLKLPANGSSRRQSYRFAPTSRMSNTYIDQGTYTPEEIIAKTENGLFVKQISAGSVNPITGEFNFAVSEGYLIENGKIIKAVKGATLIGKGQNVLRNIDLVGNDLSIGQGYCFASSGAIFIGAGQPTLRIEEMVVGGGA